MELALGRDARAAAFLPDEASVDNRSLSTAVIAAAKAAGASAVPRSGSDFSCEAIKSLRGREDIGEAKRLLAGHVVIAAGCWTSQIREAATYASNT